MLTAGLYAWGWHAMHPAGPHWVAYVPPMALGVGFMLVALVPLVRMPNATEGDSPRVPLLARPAVLGNEVV